jgi:Immunoglobulin-like domain of bacterial spore germination
MNDDDQLRRLLSDAVSDIEPRDRIAEIRASVHADPQVVPMSRPRPWLYALSGAVASAAVIGVIAYTTHALSGPDDNSNGLVAGPAHSRPSSSPVATATASDSATPPSSPSSPSTSPPAATTGAQAYAVYYVGANAAGRPVLYREWHRGPHLPAADPGGKGGDVLTEAVQDSLATLPLDPDYRTPWHALATLGDASYRTTGAGGTLHIGLKDTGIAQRPTSMTAAEARAAVQQLVYTAQAAIGKREPVVFTIGRKANAPTTLLGVDISQPIRNAPILRTLSLVNISSPNEGDQVSGKLTVTGTNNSFEGTSVIYLERHGKKYLVTPTIGGQGGNKLYPWTVTLDTTKVAPGEYTLVAQNDDPSGQGHPDTDTRTIEVK